MEKDPVCGMLVRPEEAAEQRAIQGRIYYFCSAACAAKFDQAPRQYVPGSVDDVPGQAAQTQGKSDKEAS
ncbi:MAG: YHS domain-containing protein [Thiobacillus sp.]|jgi:Cu+-exporting ATPase|uniref:YHS domain-containing protein n=1 Tax=Thiobacillus sp. TaxID=924 RepID=UPI0028956948|nr:YHS domain-containing protein [Thiobacillus sp.]MDT3706224.1 YHS domain-containing protein [Thiobacillus sp.]